MARVRKHTPLLFLITLLLGAFAIMQPKVSETAEPVGATYAILQGRPRGQLLNGGTDPNDNLVLNSTKNATKGHVVLANDGSLLVLPTTRISGAGTGSGLDADLLDGHDASYFITGLASAPSLLFGRGSANGAGVLQEITLGAGLVMTGTELSATGTQSSEIVSYTYSAATTEPPAAGQIRFDGVHPYTGVTKVWQRFVSAAGRDLYWMIMSTAIGSTIIIQDQNDHTKDARFTVTAAPIDKGAYAEIPVTWKDNGAALAGGQPVIMQSVAGAAPAGGGAACESDPNCVYAPGRVGGQTVYGGTAEGDDLTLQGSANLGLSGDVVVAPGGGNVGIATPAPQYLLDIFGGDNDQSLLHLAASSGVGGAFLGPLGASGAQLSGGASFNGTWTAHGALASIIEAVNGATIFYGNTGLTDETPFTPTERMRIDATGNVGIGTSSPGTLLDVSGASSTTYSSTQVLDPGVRIVNRDFTANNGSSLRFSILGTAQQVIPVAAITGIFTNHTAAVASADLAFQNRNGGALAESMRITSAGNVGIGAPNPQVKLEVSGAVDPSIRISEGTGGATSYTSLMDTSTGLSQLWKVTASGIPLLDLNPLALDGVSGQTIRFFRSSSSTGATAVQIFKGDGSATPNAQIGAQGTDTYFALNNGNVGIGQGAPGYLLDIGGGGANSSRFHILAGTAGGLFLAPFNDNGGQLSTGASVSGGTWTARATSSSILSMSSGATAFYSDTGLTSGTTFTPTARANLAASGAFSIYNNFDTTLSTNTPLTISATNANAGTGAYAAVGAYNTVGDVLSSTRILTMGTAWPTAAPFFQDSGVLVAEGNLSGGLSIAARATAGDIRFYAGGSTERFHIDSTGVVSAYNNFDVTLSQNTVTQANVSNVNAGTGAYAQIGAYNGATVNDNMRIIAMGTAWTSSGPFVTDSGVLVSGGGLSGGMSIATGVGDMRFYTNGFADANERVRILANGYVGIGTTSPQRPLQITDAMRLTPRATAPTTPASGDIYVDSTPAPDALCFYNGTDWDRINAGGTDADCQ